MRKITWTVVLGLAISGFVCVRAEDATTQEMRSLDEQVQEIKTDVLGIAAELNRLEEKLLYPSSTQLAVFVSIAEGETFRLDSMQINIDGELATHYLYGFKELDALQHGGVQRVYTGNVSDRRASRSTVSINGKTTSGDDFNSTGDVCVRQRRRAEAARYRTERPAAIELGEGKRPSQLGGSGDPCASNRCRLLAHRAAAAALRRGRPLDEHGRSQDCTSARPLYYAQQGYFFEALERLDAELGQHRAVDEPALDSSVLPPARTRSSPSATSS